MDPAAVAALALAVGLVAALVVLIRTRRALGEAREAQTQALSAQERTAELAVAAERIRIAREMHDVLAHSLAIMVAQADGGSYVTADAEASRRAFVTIAETGRAALADTSRILGVLRTGGDEPAPLTPGPDEASCQALVDRARAAGLNASLIRLGRPRLLPAASRTALQRICQESLTNVLKHAGPQARVTVTENWRDDDVVLTISDAGGAAAPTTRDPLAGHGLGLLGMRERAELVGGSLDAAATDDGFTVRAVLPLSARQEER